MMIDSDKLIQEVVKQCQHKCSIIGLENHIINILNVAIEQIEIDTELQK